MAVKSSQGQWKAWTRILCMSIVIQFIQSFFSSPRAQYFIVFHFVEYVSPANWPQLVYACYRILVNVNTFLICRQVKEFVKHELRMYFFVSLCIVDKRCLNLNFIQYLFYRKDENFDSLHPSYLALNFVHQLLTSKKKSERLRSHLFAGIGSSYSRKTIQTITFQKRFV